MIMQSKAWLRELQIKIHVSLITWSLDAYLLSLLTFLRTGLTLKWNDKYQFITWIKRNIDTFY